MRFSVEMVNCGIVETFGNIYLRRIGSFLLEFSFRLYLLERKTFLATGRPRNIIGWV